MWLLHAGKVRWEAGAAVNDLKTTRLRLIAGIPVRNPPSPICLGQVIFSLISLKGENMIPPIDCCINVLPGDERWGVLCFRVIWLRSGWEKTLVVLLQCQRACDGHLERLHFLCCLCYDETLHWLYYSICPLDMLLYPLTEGRVKVCFCVGWWIFVYWTFFLVILQLGIIPD